MLSQSDSPTIAPVFSAVVDDTLLNLSSPPKPHSDDDFFSSASFASSSSSNDLHTDMPSTPSPSALDRPQILISWASYGKITLDWVMDLITTFDWSSKNLPPADLPSVLPVQVFDSLTLSASKIFHKEPNCVRINYIGSDSNVVIVGDVHGQLHNVPFLLRDAGFPADDRFFDKMCNYQLLWSLL